MWKRPSLFYWVTHQKYSKEKFAALLGDLKVERGSENLPCAQQCHVRGLLGRLHSQLADPPWGHFHNQLYHPEMEEMCCQFFWDERSGHCS